MDGRPPREADEVNRAGNRDSGSPQAYDYANPDQSGPNAGYMRFDPDEDVRRQQDDEIQKNLAAGARGLGEIVVGGVTGNPALVRQGAMRYAETTGLVDRRTVQVLLGAYQWLISGAGLPIEPAKGVPEPTVTKQVPSSVEDVLKGAAPGKISKPGMGSLQYTKQGGMSQADVDFNSMTQGLPVKIYSNGIRSAILPDGSTVSVRLKSSQGNPTLQIDPTTGNGNPVKIRYE